MLTEGITKQFRNQFSGCPLSTPAAITQTILRQNVPNPFVNNTTIRFFIPESISKAQLVICDDRGNAVKTFNLTQRGEGSIEFITSNLKHGVFTYSIIADGKVVDSKKMVR
jgi:hypothetical protein